MAWLGRIAVLSAALFLVQAAYADEFDRRCAALTEKADPALGVVDVARTVAAGRVDLLPRMYPPGDAPRHCLVQGRIGDRVGIDGERYAVRYDVRLPADWNGRFLFQGGGGNDGVLRQAVGTLPGDAADNALSRGYAVAATDAGHVEAPGPTGTVLYGLDPQAREDMGHAAVTRTHAAAMVLVRSLYGRDPARRYFVGCSNGGRQGMVAAQRQPDLFDGVVAVAPGYRPHRAALETLRQMRAVAAVAPRRDGLPDTAAALTQAEMERVRRDLLHACDTLDGLADGMVQDVAACRYDPAASACGRGGGADCLAPEKAAAVADLWGGGPDVAAPGWPRDPAVAGEAWRRWHLGDPTAPAPGAGALRGAVNSLTHVYMAPPALPQDPVGFALSADLDAVRRATIIDAPPHRAAATFMAADSADIDAFAARGGRMLIVHGTADVVFSAFDSVAWVEDLASRYGAAAVGRFARLFLVPGMEHCRGGRATDRFDALAALETWVERDAPPEAIPATAPGWDGRARPLCPWPLVARYVGGPADAATSFACGPSSR